MRNLISISLLSIAILAMTLSSCEKENDPPYLQISPSNPDLNAPPGTVIEFRVRAFAGDNDLRNLVITEKPVNSVTSTIKDTTLSGESADFFFVYNVPTAGTEEILLRFTIYDKEDRSNSSLTRVTIDGAALLEQSTGHQLRSKYNLLNDAFHISGATVISLDAPDPDSTLADIREFDTEDDDNLSRIWTSLTNKKFVKNNAYNYAEATNASAESSFNSSSQQQIISDLQENDILITRYDSLNNRYAVIRIVDIVDEPGTDDDYYEFNMKK